MPQTPDDSQEGLVDQILGLRTTTGEEVREADRRRDVAGV